MKLAQFLEGRMQGFLMEVYHAKKRKKKKLSFTRLLNNKFLCFRQVVTKHKFKYVTSFMYNDKDTSYIGWIEMNFYQAI